MTTPIVPESHPTEKSRPRAYGVNGFCQAYGLSRATAYNMIADGRLHSVKIGGRRLIPADAAEALLRGEAA